MTFAAVILPVTVPPDGGHGGLPPPPQKKTTGPPFVPFSPKWMCAAVTGVLRPEKLSRYEIEFAAGNGPLELPGPCRLHRGHLFCAAELRCDLHLHRRCISRDVIYTGNNRNRQPQALD